MANSHLLVGATTNPTQPVVRRISPSDLYQSLARGIDDFTAMPIHAVFLCVVYPLLGLFLIALTMGHAMLPLAFPIAAGFALIGPIAAIGLYELSRRREAVVGQFVEPRLGRAAFAVARRHRRARPAADGDLSDLARGRRCDLRRQFRLRGAASAAPIRRSRSSTRRRDGLSSWSAPASASCSRCWC